MVSFAVVEPNGLSERKHPRQRRRVQLQNGSLNKGSHEPTRRTTDSGAAASRGCMRLPVAHEGEKRRLLIPPRRRAFGGGANIVLYVEQRGLLRLSGFPHLDLLAALFAQLAPAIGVPINDDGVGLGHTSLMPPVPSSSLRRLTCAARQEASPFRQGAFRLLRPSPVSSSRQYCRRLPWTLPRARPQACDPC
jgi:hypothetical protein